MDYPRRKREARSTANAVEGFYDALSDKYDSLTSNRSYDQQVQFFLKVFEQHKVRSVLDCACGTGKHLIKLAAAGFDTTGSDISAKMLDQARRNAKNLGVDPALVRADFKRLSRVFTRKFDAVLCWGNALPHELSERGILSGLRNMHDVLNEGGVVLIQTRNLDKWARERRRFTSILHREPNGDRKFFVYALDFYRTRVRFNVISILEFDGTPKFEVNPVDYRIVSGRRLKELMGEAGFRQIRLYADANLSEFDASGSELIIAVGRK